MTASVPSTEALIELLLCVWSDDRDTGDSVKKLGFLDPREVVDGFDPLCPSIYAPQLGVEVSQMVAVNCVPENGYRANPRHDDRSPIELRLIASYGFTDEGTRIFVRYLSKSFPKVRCYLCGRSLPEATIAEVLLAGLTEFPPIGSPNS